MLGLGLLLTFVSAVRILRCVSDGGGIDRSQSQQHIVTPLGATGSVGEEVDATIRPTHFQTHTIIFYSCTTAV
jgi:hypothetical protein